MLTRRRLLKTTALSGAAVIAGRDFAAAADRLLPIPQLIDAGAIRQPVELKIGQGKHAYRADRPVESYGYSADVLGPVIRLKRGQTTDFSIENRMSHSTTVHWHGLIVPGAVDGGPHNAIAPGGRVKLSLAIDQPETTAWFHPHPHGDTARQVYSGLAGMLIVEDGTAERLGLPHHYGVDDLPLILQDRYLDSRGAPIYRPRPMDIMAGYRGDTIIVNGVVAPVAIVPKGLVRLRVLNGANARFFDLGFSDRRTFHVIASDGGYLPVPVAMQNLPIAPGERYEIVVDFADGETAVLQTGPDNNSPMMSMMGNNLLAGAANMMTFRVDPDLPAATRSLPDKLVDVARLDLSKVAERRRFVLNDMMGGMGMAGRPGFGRGRDFAAAMGINGRSFDMERIDFEVKRESLELWHIAAGMMAHPFHVHGTQFQIVSMNGERPQAHLRGWKDTVVVDQDVQILVPHTRPAATEHPFMFHCHILEHEDAGMMGQFACV